jgi:glucan phosphoethanolaminetransferase (alkaline phosphatase superfamily)
MILTNYYQRYIQQFYVMIDESVLYVSINIEKIPVNELIDVEYFQYLLFVVVLNLIIIYVLNVFTLKSQVNYLVLHSDDYHHQ